MQSMSRRSDLGGLERDQAEMLLAELGVSVARCGLARTPEEAAVIAVEFGYPVALKISSTSVEHKTEIGGVRLNLPDAGFDGRSVRGAHSDRASVSH